jgi:CheY-like chemotaxis protein
MNPSLLLVEDDRDIRRALYDVLTEEGYHVETAANGYEALARLTEGYEPQLILLDAMMPGLSGYEVFARLQCDPHWRSIPVTLLSADGMLEEKAHEFGISSFLKKPVDLAELYEVVESQVWASSVDYLAPEFAARGPDHSRWAQRFIAD